MDPKKNDDQSLLKTEKLVSQNGDVKQVVKKDDIKQWTLIPDVDDNANGTNSQSNKKQTVEDWKKDSKKSSKKWENENMGNKEYKNYYIILSKWQLYSFLRKWYISSFSCGDNDPIREKFLKNNILYIFNEDNLPVVEWTIKETTQFDVIVEIEFDKNSKYIVKKNSWIVWLKWFLPVTVIKGINLIGDSEHRTFITPVPNENNNFVIPEKLCVTNLELYKKCTNEFIPIESWEDNSGADIVEKMKKFDRLLWAYFFSNFWVYANDISEDYSAWFLSLVNETYSSLHGKVLQNLQEVGNDPLKIMRVLAFQWEFSKIQSPDELKKLLFEKNIINLSDGNYINEQYQNVSWFRDLEEFFNHKKDSPDNSVWQIITYLIKFCNNKSLETRSRELSEFVMQMFDELKPDILTLFTLGLCCWFNNIVCENINKWRRELKDIFLPLRMRITKDLYDFVETWVMPKDDNLVKKTEDKPLWENESKCVFKKERYLIQWKERRVIAEKRTYSMHYLEIMKARYWKEFDKIKEWTYMLTLLKNRVPEFSSYNNITTVVNLIISKVSSRDEELENVIKLDRDYVFKK